MGESNKNKHYYPLSSLPRDSPFVFLCDRVPGHVDGLDGAKGHKGLSDCVLLELKADAAHIHPTHEHQRLVPLQ